MKRENLKVYYHGTISSLRYTSKIRLLAISNTRYLDNRVLLLDSMLGKLARWLRLLGLSVRYNVEIEDSALVLAKEIVVTRDEALAYRRFRLNKGTVLLQAERLKLQLASILRLIKSVPSEDSVPVVRYCSICGETLLELPREKLLKVMLVEPIPDRVLRSYNRFWYCPRCRKIYWPGSHHRKIRALYSSILHVSSLIDIVYVRTNRLGRLYLILL